MRWPRSFPCFLLKFSKSPTFEKTCIKVFQDADHNADGSLDFSELYVSVLKLYDQLNRTLPCRLRVPTRDEMQATLGTFDTDKSGQLTQGEFLELCRSLVGAGRNVFDSVLFKALAVVAIRILIIPAITLGIKEVAKRVGADEEIVNKVPNTVLNFGLEVAAKGALPLPL